MNAQSQRVQRDRAHRSFPRKRGRVGSVCRWAASLAAVLALSGINPSTAGAAAAKHAIAMHGEPALPPDFAAFPYVEPNAPKGGQLTKCILGSFDSLNPFNGKGLPAGDLNMPDAMRGQVIESLMTRGYDEPFTLYG